MNKICPNCKKNLAVKFLSTPSLSKSFRCDFCASQLKVNQKWLDYQSMAVGLFTSMPLYQHFSLIELVLIIIITSFIYSYLYLNWIGLFFDLVIDEFDL